MVLLLLAFKRCAYAGDTVYIPSDPFLLRTSSLASPHAKEMQMFRRKRDGGMRVMLAGPVNVLDHLSRLDQRLTQSIHSRLVRVRSITIVSTIPLFGTGRIQSRPIGKTVDLVNDRIQGLRGYYRNQKKRMTERAECAQYEMRRGATGWYTDASKAWGGQVDSRNPAT